MLCFGKDNSIIFNFMVVVQSLSLCVWLKRH
jgi:hypothetical protein